MAFSGQSGSPRSAAPEPFQSLGFCLVCLLCALLFARVIEFLPVFIKVLRPALTLLAAAAVFAVLTGRITRLGSSPISISILLFTGWSVLGLPFSIWHGGAFQAWTSQWLPALLAFVAVFCFTNTLDQCRNLMHTIAASMLAVVALCYFMGSARFVRGNQGRFGLDLGSLSNPNTLAMVFLIGIPFCLYTASQAKRLWRLPAAVGLVAMAATILRTGSRAGVVTLGIIGILIFIPASIPRKVLLVAGACIAISIGLMFSEGSAAARLKAIWTDDDRTPMSSAEQSAVQSSKMRAELLRRSLIQTARNPIFGVGIGLFTVADSAWAAEQRTDSLWHVSHNGYTQLSSETGIPGFLLYIISMFVCWRRLRAIERSADPTEAPAAVANLAFALRLSLVAYAILVCFSSCAYEFYFPILAALIASLDIAVRESGFGHDENRASMPQLPNQSLAPVRWDRRPRPT